jgi:hypothetical protein
MEKNLYDRIHHSSWDVRFEDYTPPVPSTDGSVPRPDELAIQLMQEYKKTVKKWSIKAINFDDEISGQQAGPVLVKSLAKYISPMNISTPGDQQTAKNVIVDASLFSRDQQYRMKCIPNDDSSPTNYLCTAIFPITLELSSDVVVNDVRGTEYKQKWPCDHNEINVIFTLRSASFEHSLQNKAKELFERYSKYLLDYITGDKDGTWSEKLNRDIKLLREQEAAAVEQRQQQAVEEDNAAGAASEEQASRAPGTGRVRITT